MVLECVDIGLYGHTLHSLCTPYLELIQGTIFSDHTYYWFLLLFIKLELFDEHMIDWGSADNSTISSSVFFNTIFSHVNATFKRPTCVDNRELDYQRSEYTVSNQSSPSSLIGTPFISSETRSTKKVTSCNGQSSTIASTCWKRPCSSMSISALSRQFENQSFQIPTSHEAADTWRGN